MRRPVEYSTAGGTGGRSHSADEKKRQPGQNRGFVNQYPRRGLYSRLLAVLTTNLRRQRDTARIVPAINSRHIRTATEMVAQARLRYRHRYGIHPVPSARNFARAMLGAFRRTTLTKNQFAQWRRLEFHCSSSPTTILPADQQREYHEMRWLRRAEGVRNPLTMAIRRPDG